MNQLDRIEKMLEFLSLGRCVDIYGTDPYRQKFYDIIDAEFDEEDLLDTWSKIIKGN